MRFPSTTLAPPLPPLLLATAEPVYDGGFAAEVLTLQQEKGATETMEVPGLPSIAPPPYPELPPSPLPLFHAGTVADAALFSEDASIENVSNTPKDVVSARADNPVADTTPPTLMPDSRIEFGQTAPFAAPPIPFLAKAPLTPVAPTTTPLLHGPLPRTLPTPALEHLPPRSTFIPAGLPPFALPSPDRTDPSALSAPDSAAKAAPDQTFPVQIAPNQLTSNQLAPSPLAPNSLAPAQPTPAQPTPVQPPKAPTAPVHAGSAIPVRAFATAPGDTLPRLDVTISTVESGSVQPKMLRAPTAMATSPVPQTPPTPTTQPEASPDPAASTHTTAMPVSVARIISSAYTPPVGASAFVAPPTTVSSQTSPSAPTPLADAFLAPVFTPLVQGIPIPASPTTTGIVAEGPPPISQAVSIPLTIPILPGPGSAGPSVTGSGAAIAAPNTQIPKALAAPQPDPTGATSNGDVQIDLAEVMKAPPKLPVPIAVATSAGPAPSPPTWPSTRRSVVAESHLPPPTQIPGVAMSDPGHPSQAPDPSLQRADSQMIAQDPTTPSLPAVIMDGSSVPPRPTPEPATAITNPESKPDHPLHPMTGVSATDASVPKNVSNMAQTIETATNPLPMSPQETIPQQSPAPAAALRPDLLEVVLPSASPTPQRAALADQLILLVQAPPQGSVTLTLAPEDLGTLRFDVQHVADSISVHLTVERPETLDLLRRHADHLAEAFRQAGFSGASFTFGGGDGGQRDRPPTPSTPQWSETTPPTAERHVAGLLDMRL